MVAIGFHASHEQIPPGQLLSDVILAEQAGFGSAMCSDHFAPWSSRQGESAFAWSWLGAAMHATELPFGIVTAPGQRYHPAILAQAIGTLESMFPGRFWAALGSGENVNEHITGDAWPRKEHRNERLRECADIMGRLLAGEAVSHDGHVKVDNARLHTLPAQRPPLIAAATSEETAEWAAGWAEGLITVGIELDELQAVITAYRTAGGRGPAYLQLHLSYARDDETALAIAHDQWRTNVFGAPMSWDLEDVTHFDQAGEQVSPEAMHANVRISSDLGQHAEWLAQYAAVGFDGLMLHHVGKHQAEFIEAFGEKVLPQLQVTAA